MAKELVKLSARERELAGKSVLRKHRREGRLPAILYGKKMKTTLPLTVLPLELEKILKTKGENAIITLEGLGSTKTAILRDIQRHPVTDRCLHADFVEVDLTVELEVDVSTKEFDIKRLQKAKTYRGLRHAWGLPVRGQKTRSYFKG